MVEVSTVPRVIRFGPFELDSRTGELRKSGLRLTLQDQPLQVLTTLLERSGDLVTREELRQRLWASDTFVDFDQGLNAAVKRLRQVLGDSAETPRFIETLPRRGYRFIGPVDRAEPGRSLGHQPADGARPAKGRRRTWLAATAAIVVAAAALTILWIANSRERSSASPSKRVLTRLTFGPAVQMEPTWSPDGRFVAYSSDRAGNFDIWVQPVAGGEAVRVTTDPAHDWQPDWSPDGTEIAFRSEREGGGLLVVQALGGDERRFATFGYRPRWSPDGRRILFAATDMTVPSEKALYLARLDGSPPTRVVQAFLEQFGRGAAGPAVAWHPDGQRLSFWGLHRDFRQSVWTVPLDGSAPVRSELAPEVEQVMAAASLENYQVDNFGWEHSGRALFFTAASHEVRNIWKVAVDAKTLRWTAGPERLTAGPGADKDLAVSRDGRRIAFATSTGRTRIWTFPFSALTGKITGDGRPLTPEDWKASSPDVTRDGRQLLFLAELSGRKHEHQLIAHSLDDGRERRLAMDDFERGEQRFRPRWSPDGSRVAYRLYRPDPRPRGSYSIRLLDVATGRDQQVTSPAEGRGDNPHGWSPDGRWIVAGGPRYVAGEYAVVLLPLSAAPRAEQAASIVVTDSAHFLGQAVMSPDGRWIAFQAEPRSNPGASTLYVVPRTGGTWMQITDGLNHDDRPRWSPDGRTLYFLSRRHGVWNVWGVRFDPTDGRPVGDAFPVTSFAGFRQMILPNVAMDLAIAADRLVLPIVEVAGGIWMLEDVDR
jgi:Tol biopolymer transport system component/DNA-binding winged helix-turn-helix (wHTH) protein